MMGEIKVRATGLQKAAKAPRNRRTAIRAVAEEVVPREPAEQVRQHWRGHVIKVTDETFWAGLSVVSGAGPDIFAEIYKRELTPADLAELAPNRLIEWNIGYRWDALGTCRRFSEIRLVPVEPFTAEEIAAAERFAAMWVDLFAENVEPVPVSGAEEIVPFDAADWQALQNTPRFQAIMKAMETPDARGYIDLTEANRLSDTAKD